MSGTLSEIIEGVHDWLLEKAKEPRPKPEYTLDELVGFQERMIEEYKKGNAYYSYIDRAWFMRPPLKEKSTESNVEKLRRERRKRKSNNQ